MAFVFFIISLLASVAGAICGIGGGVIIKPTLDMFHLASVSTISFLSGCTVLSMSLYSVGKSMRAGDSKIDGKIGTPLAIGAAVGGIAGKQMFTVIKGLFSNANTVGAVQSICLFLITFGTLLYTLRKDKINTLHTTSTYICLLIGLILGILSSFLGIGGGPINLVVLYFFFSMDTKTAAQNSLYIILFSQITSLLSTLITRTVPKFTWLYLILMVFGGIFGGMLGRVFNKRMNNQAVEKLFIVLMVIIMCVTCLNGYHYSKGI